MIYWLNCGCSVGRQSTRKKQYKLEVNYTNKQKVASKAERLPVPCTQEAMKETGSRPFRNWGLYERKQRFLDNTLQNARGEIRVSIIL